MLVPLQVPSVICFVLLRRGLWLSLELPGSAGSTGSEFQDHLSLPSPVLEL